MKVAKFPLGQVVATSNAATSVPHEDMIRALSRHVSGDWGDVCARDWQANDQALQLGERLLSVYETDSGVKFYVITEWDRSSTTILLPEDY